MEGNLISAETAYRRTTEATSNNVKAQLLEIMDNIDKEVHKGNYYYYGNDVLLPNVIKQLMELGYEVSINPENGIEFYVSWKNKGCAL